MDILDNHPERLSDIGKNLTCNLSCSGKASRKRNPSQNEQLVQILGELSSLFDSLDLVLVYQNVGESRTDLDVLTEQLEEDRLSLSPDLHARQAGDVDPIAFIAERGNRIASIHLRDYNADGTRTVALVEGELAYESLKSTLEGIDFLGDLIVELILPSGNPPDRPLLDILKASRDTLSNRLSI
ncbi:TPA: hypothetical protein DCE37_15435 [Candidatus Latescibacteria bacterium]|nr:hypothetical protein [Candidatus Latescibacterota bacterium]